jgi:hypothetical protein
MGENIQVVVAVALLVAAYLLSRRVHAWRMRQACQTIFRDLGAKGAVGAARAAALPYASTSIFRFGMKDHRPKAVEFLVANELLGRTSEGRFFLTEKGASALRAMQSSEAGGGRV